MAQTFDVTFKYLFRRSQGVLSRLLFGEVVDWPNVELPDVRNPRADLLARTAEGHLRQVELQFQNDPAMPFRMVDYYVGIRRLYPEPLYQTVLYAGREPLRMTSFYASPTTRHEYTILNLREMDGEELLASDDWTDNEWALLTKSDPERVFHVVSAKLRTLPDEEQQKAASTFVILGGILGIEEELERRLQDEMIDLLENKVLGPAIRQGLAQGRSEALSSVLRKRLLKRFGPLPAWAEARITSATPEVLEAWSLQLDDNPSLETLLKE
jgi:hypothetical protein